MKIVYFIRHGEATHNVDFNKVGEIAYYQECNRDSKLTSNGIKQAKNVIVPEVDIVITSPLSRALATTYNIFGKYNIPIMASDIIRETNNSHVCNNRMKKSELESKYLSIDFSRLTENDDWWETGETFCRKNALDNLLNELEYERIAIVSHGTFLQEYFWYKNISAMYLDNCKILKCGYKDKILNII